MTAFFHPFLGFAVDLAQAAGEAVLPFFRSPLLVDNKGLKERYDPVTEADRAAEKVMRSLIQSTYPTHGIVGEEFAAVQPDAEWLWVLDPIDGTKAFITGLPIWGQLIGLLHHGQAAFGLMNQPFVEEMFYGDGQKAFVRNRFGEKALHTRACITLEDAVLATTSPALFKADERPRYDRVENKVRLTRYGTDCYAYAMLAAGLIDVVVEAGLESYDVAALIPIVTGAGGVITTWDGAPPTQGGRIVACATPELHRQTLALLS